MNCSSCCKASLSRVVYILFCGGSEVLLVPCHVISAAFPGCNISYAGRDLKDDHGKGKHKFFKHPINFFKKIKKPIIIKKPIVVKKPDVKLIVVKKKEKEV
jgi:hypothetical protein